ncbi:hypothetical protein Taro_029801 [Colocasia esculenta]|uniref:Uncharacterized protein n=1 Tax=Colocasia esculenta TaxID=4460 RepID=A0A843VMB6_COLES|nr:hypothetical protein [Colocasia esculenta]
MIRAHATGCSCCAACVASVVTRRVCAIEAQLALDSLAVVFLVWRTLSSKSRCSVCRVASLVEHCNTCLWLLSAWRWLVVSSGEVLPKPFSVGSGGSEDCFMLVSVVTMLPQSLRCAVGLAGAFWLVFPEWCLGGSGGGSSLDRPLSLLAEVLPKSALCVSCVVVGNYILCRVRLATEWVAGWLVPTSGQRFGMVLLCCRACSPGAWHLRACPRSERLLPLLGTPVLVSLLRVAPGYERARVGSPRERTLELRRKRWFRIATPLSHCLSLRWFRSHVVVLGMRPQLGQAAVLRVLCVSMAALSRPCAGAEAGARLASRACGLRVPLLAASGGGLVAVVVMTFPHDTHASGGFRSVSSQFLSPALGCQSVVALACVASRPCGVSGVRGGSACGPLSLWRSEVAVLVVRRRSHLVVMWSR